MKNICLYFQIHHPFSFQTFRFFDVGEYRSYYDDLRIEREIQEVSTNYYLPTNNFLLKLIHQFKGQLKLSFYISGTTLDQFLAYSPKLINSFRQLADTGMVEFTGGTDSHSIASLAENSDEFIDQIYQYKERILQNFGQNPKLFVNSDLLFIDQIAHSVAKTGYSAIFTNGAKKVLQWRSPNYLYFNKVQKRMKILFRNETVSNEMSRLLGNTETIGKPNSIKQILSYLYAIKPEEPIINIYLNYMSLGGNGMADKQRFFRKFVFKIISDPSFCLCLPSEILERSMPVAEIGTDMPVCWKDGFHSSYHPGNDLQKEAIKHLFKLSGKVKSIENQNLEVDWKYLQTSDHFHLMDENHPNYIDPDSNSGIFRSKYDAFINYMNILEDFRLRLKAEKRKVKLKKTFNEPIQLSRLRKTPIIRIKEM
jgi:alpha-amylase